MRPAALGPHLILLITPKAPPPGTHHTAGLGLQHTIGAGDKTQPTAGSAVIWPSSQWQALPSFIKFRVLLSDPPYICPSHCRYLRSSLLLQDHRQLQFPMNQLRPRDAAQLNVASRQLPVASPRVRDHAPPPAAAVRCEQVTEPLCAIALLVPRARGQCFRQNRRVLRRAFESNVTASRRVAVSHKPRGLFLAHF